MTLVAGTDSPPTHRGRPSDNRKGAVFDGRDSAVVVVPEVNRDGSWFIGDVSICGDPDLGPAAIDG